MAGGDGRVIGNVILNPEGERVEVVHTPAIKCPEKPTLRQRPCLYLTR